MFVHCGQYRGPCLRRKWGVLPMVNATKRAEAYGVKTTKHHNDKSYAPIPDPMEQDPQYGHSEWVDPELKQAVAQEERRTSRHAGKTIKRPRRVARTMSA